MTGRLGDFGARGRGRHHFNEQAEKHKIGWRHSVGNASHCLATYSKTSSWEECGLGILRFMLEGIYPRTILKVQASTLMAGV